MLSLPSKEQILALAPDAASAKAANGLTAPRKWQSLGRDARSLWGECQGSGKDPYAVAVDLSETVFKCSCPSHKQPCKHGLALGMLAAGQPELLAPGEAPSWVATWIAGRDRRAAKKTEGEAGEKKPDLEAQAKRASERMAKVSAGVEELELWLRDLMRRGLASAQGQPYRFWDDIAARMVDAQAGGLARMLRDMAGIPATGEGWPERLLERLGRIHLLLESFKRLDTLPPDVQADVRGIIGWSLKADEIAAGPGVRDFWAVAGQRLEEEAGLTVRRTWLAGRDSGRMALLLQFAAYGQVLEPAPPPGTLLDAELAFWPGNYPLRALIKERFGEAGDVFELPGLSGVGAMLHVYAQALSRNPWLPGVPMVLEGITPFRDGERWCAHDEEGMLLPFAVGWDDGWTLLALSGGHPVALCGEWNGEGFTPLCAVAEGEFAHLGGRS